MLLAVDGTALVSMLQIDVWPVIVAVRSAWGFTVLSNIPCSFTGHTSCQVGLASVSLRIESAWEVAAPAWI